LPREIGLALFPLIAQLLGSDNYVVHTYAAMCIDRFLTIKDNNVERYNREHLRPFLPAFIGGLFKQLAKQESKDNDYVMRGIVRTIAAAKQDILPLAGDILTGLNTMLQNVMKAPVNPTFNHFLFEALGALIKNVCEAQPAAAAQFEPTLLPSFQYILVNDVSGAPSVRPSVLLRELSHAG
jgi:exportin-2 (importin alpha re-exporter)